jgi:hypothetical protein
VRKH